MTRVLSCAVKAVLGMFSFAQALQPLPPRDQTADSSSINTVFLYVNLEIFRLRWLLISLDCWCWRLKFSSTIFFHRHVFLLKNDEQSILNETSILAVLLWLCRTWMYSWMYCIVVLIPYGCIFILPFTDSYSAWILPCTTSNSFSWSH